MKNYKNYSFGILLTALLAWFSVFASKLTPHGLIGAGVFALLFGMLLNPLVSQYQVFEKGFQFTSKKILRLAIILMGMGLSFGQVVEVGKFSLIVMFFTLVTAFGGGYFIGKFLKMDWKLSSLISAGTGICGGSAIAAVAPVIDAEESDIAYAISATFIFDIIMVVLFPIMGHFFQMTDLGFGLWTGTAINDTSSVVAAGYAYSDAAGKLSVIVKLTRTLSIVPIVLIFSYINARIAKKSDSRNSAKRITNRVDIKKIFPWFILMFLAMVALKSTGLVPDTTSDFLGQMSKFLMVMALGAIGLRTNFSKLSNSGFTPMVHGFIISTLVVVISFLVQIFLGQI
ncbi:MAG: YeiH family protein [Thermotaleaceae bacterium]